ncbi:MAG: glucose-6-phosphate isomerase [Planctomycetes bacterium]|nr:glucose-6-phosphate isomerase [Planctomycetota bacterium]
MTNQELWNRFKTYYFNDESLGLALDISRMNFSDSFFSEMDGRIQKAFEQMDALEKGGIANPDEDRMVGHYWLRDSALTPTPELRQAIDTALAKVKKFAADVHGGRVRGQNGRKFRNLLVVGIGGSALGPQFVSHALGGTGDLLTVHFFDNTDPDGMDRVLARIGKSLGETLCIVISKSGGTKESRNGMLEAKAAFLRANLRFENHAVATTSDGSDLDKVAVKDKWLERFPMWDWVGGRTSELSPVGLLPARLQGLDIDGMLAGAKAVDAVTRLKDPRRNPAALLALMWYHAGSGKGLKDMVILPYKDRLELFSRYLQQLVMESLGKERDMDGNVVHQGIAVYGNKGSTDQHAYVQQLRDGVPNFFVTFIEVLRDRKGPSMPVEPGVTSGDYLSGFLQGTRRALFENGRESITLTIRDVSPESVGKLIALYERAVGFYGSLVHINAYHQPGVEAGKKAAGAVIAIQHRVVDFLEKNKGQELGLDAIAAGIDAPDEIETVFKVLQHLSANGEHGVLLKKLAATPFESTFGA